MVHAPPPARRSGDSPARAPHGTRSARALVAIAALAALLHGCGIDNVPTRDEAADLAWIEVQAAHAARVVLAHDLLGIADRVAREPAPTSDAEATALGDAIDAARRALSRVERADVSPGTLADPIAFARLERRRDELGATLAELVRALGAAGPVGGAVARGRLAELPDRLAATESDVAFARAGYNEAARRYNTELRTVPGRWWHRFMYSTMAPRPGFDTPDGSGARSAARPDVVIVRRAGPPARGIRHASIARG